MADKRLDAIKAAGITTAAVVAGIVIVGQAQDTDAYRSAERVPFVGPVLTGIKAAWRKVYNP